MKKILLLFSISLIFMPILVYAEEYYQNQWLTSKLIYKAEELLRQVNHLQQQTNNYLYDPDWNEKRLLNKLNDLKDYCEQLNELSRAYYKNEEQIFSLLGDLTWRIQEILDIMKYNSSLKIFAKDCFSCLERIGEYKRIILISLASDIKDQASDLKTEFESWVDKENKSQLKLLEKALKFGQSCQEIHRELESYYFDLRKVTNLILQLYDLSLNLNANLKKEKTTKSLNRKWDICFNLVHHLKNTIQMLQSNYSIQNKPEEQENYPPIGYLDAASRAEISGWAFDIDAGIKPINVHIYINEQHVATVLANEKREDLKGKVHGLKEPYHGFRWKPKNIPKGRFLVKIYAINVPEGDNPLLGQKIVY